MQKSLSIAIMVAGLALGSAVFAAGKDKPAPESAAPFGVTLGKTTCEEAGALFSSKLGTTDNGLTIVTHPSPRQVLPGAKGIQVMCIKPSTPAILVSVGASKNEVAATYKALTKYKLVKGGPPPNLGDGYALFNDAAGNFIQLVAPHLSFEYELSYMTAETYNRILAYEKAQRDEKVKQQGNL